MDRYRVPVLAADDLPVSLLPESKQQGEALTPDTPVVIMNRGLGEIRDTFDAQHYVIGPGPTKYWVPYGAARHFQERCIIPGTRALGAGGFQSYIAILGVDPPELCEMFDLATFQRQQAHIEALDRRALDPDRQTAKPVATSAIAGAVSGQGVAGRRVEVYGGSRDDVLAPPEGGSIARQAEAEAMNEGWKPGGGASPLVAEDGRAPGDARPAPLEDAPAAPPIRGSRPQTRR